MKILKSLSNILVLVIVVVIIGIIFIGSQNSGGRNLPDYSKTQAFKLEKLDTPHSFLYQCANNVVRYSFFSHDNFTAKIFKDDLIFVTNNESDILYLYTPTYAGKSQFETNKKGEPIKTVTDDGSDQYNIRIPYSPSSDRDGFYYLTIEDNVRENLHNYRGYFQPIFIAGPAQNKPDFSNHEIDGYISITSLGSTTITDHLANVDKYHPLEIEDEVWSNLNKQSVNSDAESILTQVIINKVDTAINELQRYDGEELADEITSLCLKAAQELDDETLLQTIQDTGI